MVAFTPSGPILSIASGIGVAAATAAAVQVLSTNNTNVQQVKLTNTDGTNDAIIGWGQSAAQAAFNAVLTNQATNCTHLMHSTIEVVTIPPNSWITAILVAGTPSIRAQAGYGN